MAHLGMRKRRVGKSRKEGDDCFFITFLHFPLSPLFPPLLPSLQTPLATVGSRFSRAGIIAETGGKWLQEGNARFSPTCGIITRTQNRYFFVCVANSALIWRRECLAKHFFTVSFSPEKKKKRETIFPPLPPRPSLRLRAV